MTRQLFRARLTFLRLDPVALSQPIHVGRARVETWHNGTRRIPVIVRRLLDAWARVKRLEAKIERRER